MISLSRFLNTKFRYVLVILTTSSFALSVLGLFLFDYFVTNNNLNDSLNQISEVASSLVYERQEILLDQYFDLLNSNKNLSSFKVYSKVLESFIYENVDSNFMFNVATCAEAETEILRIEACSPLIKFQNILGLLFFSFTFALILYIFFRLFEFKLINYAQGISDSLLSSISDVGSENYVSSGIEEIETVRTELISKSRELQIAVKNSTFVNLSKKVFHDISSPISVIYSISKKEKIDENDLFVFKENAKTLVSISESLVQTGLMNKLPRCYRYDLNERLSSMILSKRIQFSSKLNEDSILFKTQHFDQIFVNPVAFDRLFSNLLNNSIESNGMPKISINVSSDSTNILIFITDNGPGFPADILSGFNNSNLVSTKAFGNGIGLLAAKETVEKYNGKMILSNETGAKISISLPLSLSISKNVPLILIEDDKYVRMSWTSEASKNCLNLIELKDKKMFYNFLSNVPEDAEVFLDSCLEDLSVKDMIVTLRNLGLTKFTIQSGLDISSFDNIDELNDIRNKTFPY